MTTCLAHLTPPHRRGPQSSHATNPTPDWQAPVSNGSKYLLRVLTGADAIRFAHHPRRRRRQRRI